VIIFAGTVYSFVDRPYVDAQLCDVVTNSRFQQLACYPCDRKNNVFYLCLKRAHPPKTRKVNLFWFLYKKFFSENPILFSPCIQIDSVIVVRQFLYFAHFLSPTDRSQGG